MLDTESTDMRTTAQYVVLCTTDQPSSQHISRHYHECPQCLIPWQFAARVTKSPSACTYCRNKQHQLAISSASSARRPSFRAQYLPLSSGRSSHPSPIHPSIHRGLLQPLKEVLSSGIILGTLLYGILRPFTFQLTQYIVFFLTPYTMWPQFEAMFVPFPTAQFP